MEQLVSALQYHFLQSLTYGRKAFYSQQIVYLLKAKIHYISKIFNVEVLNAEFELDQIDEKHTNKRYFSRGKSMICLLLEAC